MDLNTDTLSLQLRAIFRDFCAEKKVPIKNIPLVFKQAVGDLAYDLGLEVEIEQKIPAGIKMMLEEESRDNKFLAMARHCPI